jgi:hypothetical protein
MQVKNKAKIYQVNAPVTRRRDLIGKYKKKLGQPDPWEQKTLTRENCWWLSKKEHDRACEWAKARLARRR